MVNQPQAAGRISSLPPMVLAVVGALLLACQPGGAPPAPAAGETPAVPRIALIMKTRTNPFFQAMAQGAQRAQQETQVDLQVRAGTQETSIDQQIQLVQNEIQAKAKAIVIAPGDSARLVPALKEAQDAGIRIVNIDNRLSHEAMAAAGMKPVPFISVDNEKGAYLAAKFVADRVHGPTEAAVIEGIRGADNSQQRKLGAERGFRSNPAIRLVAEVTANWQIDEAYTVAHTLFRDHPRIGVLFCANDMMAIGAMKYLQETHRTKVQVIGFDALEETRPALKAHQLAATVNQQADQQGYLGVMTACQWLHGQAPAMDIQVDALLVTPDTK